MAKRKSARKVAATTTEVKTAPAFEAPRSTDVRPEHKTFSHVMYILFLVSTTIAAFFTFASFKYLSVTKEFYGILSIVFLLWAFLFWEFGHRIHHAGSNGWQ